MTAPQRSSRRAFLQGKAAVQALGDAAQAALPPATDTPAAGDMPGGAAPVANDGPSESYLIRVGRRAMACEFEVLLNAGQYADATEWAVEALDLVDRLEQQMTVYRDTSEISRLNRAAGEREVEVEPRLFELLRQAVELHRATGGAYDITSGPLSKVWGFFRRAGRMPSCADLQEALGAVGSQHLSLDCERWTIRFSMPGVEINLGSIGKGYALDRAAELLEQHGVADFLLHGGRSSVLARGSRAGEAAPGWRIGVRDPLRPDQRLGEVRVRNRALATSGSGQQFFYHEGKRYGHILDPRTGRPADALLSATVLAPTAAEADSISTAFFVMGLAPARAFCRQRADLGAVLVTAGPRDGTQEIFVQGIEPADWKLLER
jgi:thiamine biosynthesis lipoprotein